ncbi:LysM peptidoglycan-binding domain-containing protein [Lactobacillus selangorensis]|nr:LysM domain-containing protein [Lactobacillus selangorensis]
MLITTGAAVSLFAVSAQATQAATVTVQSGDTLWGYSQKYDVSLDRIVQANGIDLTDYLLLPGQTITIPDATTTAPQSTQVQAATTTQTVQPAVQATTQTVQQPAAQPAVTTQTTTAPAAATASSDSTAATDSLSTSDSAAKAWIANKESGGSYSANNGAYVGKYQLSASYLNGDYSAANQERAADQYVTSKYGSWSAAQSFWESNGYY